MKYYFILFVFLLVGATGTFFAVKSQRTLIVEATAYNSVPSQTEGDPNLAAWGDTLRPGIKAIAVSPDLIEIGLTHNQTVRIEGLTGSYRVLDRTHSRFARRIDIYMGEDIQAAKKWGKRRVTIRW